MKVNIEFTLPDDPAIPARHLAIKLNVYLARAIDESDPEALEWLAENVIGMHHNLQRDYDN